MDKKYNLEEMGKVFEFQLNTIYNLVRIKNWLLNSLKEEFKELYVRGSDGDKFAIANGLYRIDLFPNFSHYAMRVTVVQLDKIDDESLINFITSLFKIINDATKDDTTKTGDFERFFFHSVELGYSLKVNDTIFEDAGMFMNPLRVEYPNMIQKEAHFETLLESDFLESIDLNIIYKRSYDKDTDYICTKIASIYKGYAPKKRFLVNEQIYLVGDVTKELLARAATLKKELNMKLNDE